MKKRIEIPTTRVRMAVLAGLVLACTTLALSFATSDGKTLALPGPLASVHAPLEQDCGTCHSSELDSIQHPLSGWVASNLDLAQSRRCVACHDLGESPLGPHGWSRGEARKLRAAAAQEVESPASYHESAVPMSSRGQIACATCHGEHRGRDNALTSLADRQCQACHTETFDHFPGAHPSFEAFPHDKRTGIHFDHLSHIQRHFRSDLQEHAPATCSSCHVPTTSGEGFQLAPFESSCGACHGEAISGATQVEGAGLPVLSFPALDLLTLEEREASAGSEDTVGLWPADATEVETTMTPITAFLLGTDEPARSDVRRFNALDRLDLYHASDEELGVVSRTAWRIKDLFLRLSTEGHEGWIAMIEERLGRNTTDRERTDLLAGLPGELVTRALEQWGFAADEELELRAAGHPPASELAESTGLYQADPARERWVSRGGWYVQHTDFSLRYRPAGHPDPFLRAWLDVCAESDEAVFNGLADPAAQGMCTKCHGIEESDEGTRIRWRANRPDHPLTRFDHRPHLISDSRTDCSTCHVFDDPGDEFARSFEQRDPGQFHSNFLAMSKDTCASCHAPEGASNRCLTCHDYHSHRPAARIPAPDLNELLERSAGN